MTDDALRERLRKTAAELVYDESDEEIAEDIIVSFVDFVIRERRAAVAEERAAIDAKVKQALADKAECETCGDVPCEHVWDVIASLDEEVRELVVKLCAAKDYLVELLHRDACLTAPPPCGTCLHCEAAAWLAKEDA